DIRREPSGRVCKTIKGGKPQIVEMLKRLQIEPPGYHKRENHDKLAVERKRAVLKKHLTSKTPEEIDELSPEDVVFYELWYKHKIDDMCNAIQDFLAANDRLYIP